MSCGLRGVPLVLLRVLSVESMRLFAGEMARVARGGDFFLLFGEMGVGKTEFARGFCERLGCGGEVRSPSFLVALEYAPPSGGLRVLHVDLFRVEGGELGLAFEEYEAEGWVVLVEWAERMSYAPSRGFALRFSFGSAPEERFLEVKPLGEDAARRWGSLASTSPVVEALRFGP